MKTTWVAGVMALAAACGLVAACSGSDGPLLLGASLDDGGPANCVPGGAHCVQR